LLEVLVAVAILALGLTIVSSAQTGVFWSYSRATHLSQAPGLARCKMSELELKLLKDGLPLLDEKDEGDCCEDADVGAYTCDWLIETVVLPNLPEGAEFGGDAGAGGNNSTAGTGADDENSGGFSEGSGSGGGPLGALAQLQQSGGSALGAGAGIGDLTEMMGGGGAGPGGGVAGMVMGLVYPDLKPMLEASIRKLTVTVHWKEGTFDRDFSVVQYVTSPQHGGFDPEAAKGLEELGEGGGAGMLEGILPGAGKPGLLGGKP
jgi:general secretion pathway protein I